MIKVFKKSSVIKKTRLGNKSTEMVSVKALISEQL